MIESDDEDDDEPDIFPEVLLADDNWVELILDSGANVSIVDDIALLHHYQLVSGRTIQGISGRTISATHVGVLEPFDPDTLVASVGKNVLSVQKVIQQGFNVAYNAANRAFMVSRSIHGRLEEFAFKLNRQGLYVYGFDRRYAIKHADPSSSPLTGLPDGQDPDGVNAAIAPAGTSNLDHGRHLNPAELRRAEAVLRLHAALGHPCDTYLGRALDCNAYRGTSLTSKDLRNARSLHGPCAGCALGKIAEAPSPASTSVEAVLRVQASYKAYGHTLSSVRSDREGAFIAMAPHLGDAGIVVDRTSSGRHSKVAERYIRTIKDHVRAVRASLPYRLPLHLVQYLVMDIVSAMNNCVNSKTGGRTPRDLLSGQKLDLDYHYKLAFGDIAIFQKRAGGIVTRTLAVRLAWSSDATSTPRVLYGSGTSLLARSA